MTLQKKATIISSLTAFVLVVVKVWVWVISWSVAVLASAIDSLLDFCVSVFNFFAVKEAEKWKDEEYNYWRWKIEALASFVEGLVIIASAIYIFYSSIEKLITWEKIEYMMVSIYVMMFSLVLTWWLVAFLLWVAKKTWSLVIKSDALHYKTDVLSNLWILVWLVLINFSWFYAIDSIIWIIIALYIGYSAFELVQTWYEFLMDRALDDEKVEKIKSILDNEKWLNSYHMLHTRRSVGLNFVSVHLVFTPKASLIEAHKVSHKIEDKILAIDPENKWEIVTHLDPYDDELCDDFHK